MTTTNTRAALFQVAQTANACDRIAAQLDKLAGHYSCFQGMEKTALALDEAASELAHHADALRESSGLNDLTRDNLAELARNISTR